MKKLELAEILELSELPDWLGSLDRLMSSCLPPEGSYLYEPMKRSLLAGKRLRPILIFYIATAYGRPIDSKTLNMAAALELLHLSTLVHDDVIDQSELRHGLATVMSKEGLAAALMCGDYMVSAAFKLAAQLDMTVVNILNDAFAGACMGQACETAVLFDPRRSEQHYFDTVAGKTSALLSAACMLGAHAADLTPELTVALQNFGYNFGISFQLLDDLADLTSTSAKLGKPVNQDIKSGVYTYPVLQSLNGKSGGDVIQLIKASNPDTKRLLQILTDDQSLTKTMALAESYAQTAYDMLKNQPKLALLQRLPQTYVSWMKSLL